MASSVPSRPMGLQKLLQEPQQLGDEIHKINVELESLIIENYKVFVENLTCSVQLQSEEQKLNQISLRMDETIHNLQSICQCFKDRVTTFVQFHKRNRKTLQSHLQLIELLEVPQLIEACTRNGFYEEALELAHFIYGLERRQLLASEVKAFAAAVADAAAMVPPDNSNEALGRRGKTSSDGNRNLAEEADGGRNVVQSIVSEIEDILDHLQQQLLIQLTEVISLPKQIQIIGILRKIDSLTIDRYLSLQRHSATSQPSRSHTTIQQTLSSGSVDIPNASEERKGRDEKDQLLRERIRSYYLQQREIKHQMDFLEAKTVWLEKNLEKSSPNRGQPSSNSMNASERGLTSSSSSSSRLGPYGRAIEMLEIRRTSLHSVITQYRSLFVDYVSSNTSAPPVRGIDPGLPEFATATILTSWVNIQIKQLLTELKGLLQQIDEGASVRSIFEQCLYFTARLGTVGCDFTALVLELFEEVTINKLNKDLELAYQQWLSILEQEKIVFETASSGLSIGGQPIYAAAGSESFKEQLIPLYNSQDLHPAIAELSLTMGEQSSDPNSGVTPKVSSESSAKSMVEDLSPPLSLLKFPPLVFLLNNCLTALNYLREFPLVTIMEEVFQLFDKYFHKIIQSLEERASSIREKGSKYFGEGFMSNLGSSSTTTSSIQGSRGLSTGKKSSTAANEKMDCLYGEAVAVDIFPYLFMCLLFSYQKLSFPAIKAYIAKNQLHPVGNAYSHTVLDRHWMTELKQSKELFGNSITNRLEGYWKSLIQAKLLDESQVQLQRTVIPLSIPPALLSTAPTAATLLSSSVVSDSHKPLTAGNEFTNPEESYSSEKNNSFQIPDLSSLDITKAASEETADK